MVIWKLPRIYEAEWRFLSASSSLIQGGCHDPITIAPSLSHALSHGQYPLLKEAQGLGK